MPGQFNGANCYEHVRQLSVAIGPRNSGTLGEKSAADYVSSVFTSDGLHPQVTSFDTPYENILAATLHTLEPDPVNIPALPLVGTPDTPAEGLDAEVVFVEKPAPPFCGPWIEGKIVVLANGGSLGMGLRDLLRFHPSGLVLVGRTLSSRPNTFRMFLMQGNRPFSMPPTLHITYADAVRLWNTRPKRARMILHTQRSQGKSYNVIAEILGNRFPEEIILVGAHMDTVPGDPGATDNAAGTATMLELARVFAGQNPARTLRFAAWGSEEGGLAGSLRYILELKKQHKELSSLPGHVEGHPKTILEQHLLNINLDVLGMALGSDMFAPMGPPALAGYVKALGDELGCPQTAGQEPYLSDNLSFYSIGVPSVSFAREGPAAHYMHTVLDDISLVDPAQLERIGRLVEVFITRTAAQGAVWPFEREVPPIPAATQAELNAHIAQVAEFLGEDPSIMK